MTGSIIGYDLNEKYCQISFYNEEQQEPQTMETALDNYKIPLIIGKKENDWVIGSDAKRLQVTKKGYIAEDLFSKANAGEKLMLGNETYEAVWYSGYIAGSYCDPDQRYSSGNGNSGADAYSCR